MLRLIMNLMRTTMHLAVAGLVGYYNFEKNGWLGVATNLCFMILGMLLVGTWQKAKRKPSEPSLEAQSLSETDTAVDAAESPERTDRAVTSTEGSTE